MIYACTGTIERAEQWGVLTHQLPTFYLDDRVQGIVDDMHAKAIAEEIVDPFKLNNVTVNMHVMVCDRSVWAA
jgi:hypothetical protein